MKQSITIKINIWVICAVLLIANIITVALWQPWNIKPQTDRNITITGSTTIETEPDQFIFSPYYQKEGSDKTKINTELSTLSNTIVSKLKELGVADSSIKTDVNSYGYGIYYGSDINNTTTTLFLTVTVNDKALAQKIEDYLITTSASGSLTPQISFSTSKQKELENQARDEALKDARTKAESSAKQLEVKLGKATKISDVTSVGTTPLPWLMSATGVISDSSAKSPTSSSSSYTIQPGLQKYSFSVQVTYELN